MPVVRVDEDVWRWLQSHASPFEDTPNSVLRRLAGLDHSTDASPTDKPTMKELPVKPSGGVLGKRVTGDSLNRQHRLGAKHALYHKDGMFYERLTAFPGVYCDPTGFVRYDNDQSFSSDRHIRIGEKVNIPGTLGAHPRYRRFDGK